MTESSSVLLILIFITKEILWQNHGYYLSLQLKTSKTQITTNIRALIRLQLHGSVAERIGHEASDMLTYREKSSNLVSSTFFIT